MGVVVAYLVEDSAAGCVLGFFLDFLAGFFFAVDLVSDFGVSVPPLGDAAPDFRAGEDVVAAVLAAGAAAAFGACAGVDAGV